MTIPHSRPAHEVEVRYWQAMHIATWNVNGLRARMEFITHWLKSRAPDVVGLQEVKVSDEDFPHANFRALGYHAVVHGEKGWNGVAVLSRTPAEAETLGLTGRENDGARLLRVQVSGLHFATVYCPNGKTLNHPDFPRKLAWLDALRDYLAGLDRDVAFVIGGDFNIVPAALDCWQGAAADGSIFCTAEERSRYRSLLDLKLTDLFRHVHPDEQKFSWWDYRGGSFHRGPRAAHRSVAGYASRGLAGAPRGDRSRVPQEEGRSHCVRSRAGVRGSGLIRRTNGSTSGGSRACGKARAVSTAAPDVGATVAVAWAHVADIAPLRLRKRLGPKKVPFWPVHTARNRSKTPLSRDFRFACHGWPLGASVIKCW